jgi:tricorn protease
VTGPKVMLINESSGSGGDYLPWSFRYVGLGPPIGTRTWGGLIGISANPRLIDGGNLTVPYFRFFDPEGRWSIENEGVPPDIEVEQTPKEVIAGRDPQLERGITEVLERLKAYKPVIPKTAPPLPTQLGK